jgi:hypothetical protein
VPQGTGSAPRHTSRATSRTSHRLSLVCQNLYVSRLMMSNLVVAKRLTGEEWDDRNLLYSLRYDLGTAILIPGCELRQA